MTEHKPLTAEEITETAVGQWTYRVDGPHREEINTFVHRLAEDLRAARAAREAAERERDRESRAHEQTIGERDAFEEQITAIYQALGGTGEWCAKIPSEPPPNSGDLGRDAFALADELANYPLRTRAEKAEQDRDRLAAECESLRAVVERLPRTADGVPITPGMRVWSVWDCGVAHKYAVNDRYVVPHIFEMQRAFDPEGGAYLIDATGQGWKWDGHYSTPEAAAEAAALAEKGGSENV